MTSLIASSRQNSTWLDQPFDGRSASTRRARGTSSCLARDQSPAGALVGAQRVDVDRRTDRWSAGRTATARGGIDFTSHSGDGSQLAGSANKVCRSGRGMGPPHRPRPRAARAGQGVAVDPVGGRLGDAQRVLLGHAERHHQPGELEPPRAAGQPLAGAAVDDAVDVKQLPPSRTRTSAMPPPGSANPRDAPFQRRPDWSLGLWAMRRRRVSRRLLGAVGVEAALVARIGVDRVVRDRRKPSPRRPRSRRLPRPAAALRARRAALALRNAPHRPLPTRKSIRTSPWPALSLTISTAVGSRAGSVGSQRARQLPSRSR